MKSTHAPILYHMSAPKRDSNFNKLLHDTARETGISISEVERTVESYFRDMAHVIEWDKTVDIHIDYIGTLVYNHKWAAKMEQIKESINGNSITQS